MDASEILVVILAMALAVLLVLSIIVLIYMIGLIKKLRIISQKTEKVVDNVEAASSFVRKAAAPAAIGKLITTVADIVKSKSKKGGKK